MPGLDVPYKFVPRAYQVPFFEAMQSKKNPEGFKRAVLVWHRRSGKDKTLLNFTIRAMWERVGTYYYLLPTYGQARKIIWDGTDGSGFRFLDHFPQALIDGEPNATEMKIRFKNGSLFQLVGVDNIDTVVGTNPIGVVFSEYSLQDPRAWDFIRPILKENGGWAVFNYTPRGKNHGWDILETAKANPETWFHQVLTIKDTGVLTDADMDAERKEGYDEEMIQQEYFVSFQGSMRGAYYADQIRRAEESKRIGNVPHDPMLPVHTFWDLGMDDSTAILFMQRGPEGWRLIDCYENSGEGLPHYKKVLDDKPYYYGGHHAPPDIVVRELGTGLTRQEAARRLGINFRIVSKQSIEDGIHAGRIIWDTLWVDEEKCKLFLRAIREYTKDWDEVKKCFSSQPRHDWTSHFADAFRYFAVQQRLVPKSIAEGGSGKKSFIYRRPGASVTGQGIAY